MKSSLCDQDNRLVPKTLSNSQHSDYGLESDLNKIEENPSLELFSVASATLTWWERHKNDTASVKGRLVRRYSAEPDFVIHAHSIVTEIVRHSCRSCHTRHSSINTAHMRPV